MLSQSSSIGEEAKNFKIMQKMSLYLDTGAQKIYLYFEDYV